MQPMLGQKRGLDLDRDDLAVHQHAVAIEDHRPQHAMCLKRSGDELQRDGGELQHGGDQHRGVPDRLVIGDALDRHRTRRRPNRRGRRRPAARNRRRPSRAPAARSPSRSSSPCRDRARGSRSRSGAGYRTFITTPKVAASQIDREDDRADMPPSRLTANGV